MNPSEGKSINFLHIPLKAYIALTLHSGQAQLLFHGKWQHGQNGLTQFAKFMSILWHAEREGDPYAEWYLIKTYDEILAAKKTFKTMESYLDERLAKFRGMEIKIYANDTPFERELRVVTPFGFMGGELLIDFDFIIRKALTLKKLGVHLKAEHYDNPTMMKALRRLFGFPSGWHRTQVTREDILEDTPKAQKAVELMGILPEAILNRQVNFPFKSA